MNYKVEFFGETYELTPSLGLYSQEDILGKERSGLAVQFNTLEGERFCTLTVSFGEFIGVKNCAYIDTNNCPFAEQLLKQGIGTIINRTGYRSGFCFYPLVRFNDDFLKTADSETYAEYCKDFNDFYDFFSSDCEDEGFVSVDELVNVEDNEN